MSEGRYYPSTVTSSNGQLVDLSTRRSLTAVLPHNDSIVESVVSRAAKFQGFLPTSNFESIQATSYVAGGEFLPHYDIATPEPIYTHPNESRSSNRTDRATTIFAILDESCGSKCGTMFPRIKINWTNQDGTWCDYVDCDSETLTIKPKPGNAIFWRNRRDDNSIHPNSLHAGLPLHKGTKLGINIWAKDA
ncbi:uncharacterized protein LY79DRAFT_594541 [Colletotrichum navitas]|uniref:Prolyl 4-hydroxylase alpha subunit domain-containing protein n=1 Tax=Colletotrichum navitas TaxID=681940 RepID=A0AAD8PLS0_9PEZI|nr:uncharacterized protein LY79DRAFT_594541 [Colletotrichum navitas]KAK1570071.1 hypothetical protein LY79DRAFT_594541 [Colletotrichum navitas]